MTNIFGETYDTSFIPDISIGLVDKKLFVDFSIPDNGTPAPTLNGNRAAVWVGQHTNRHNEKPVLLAILSLESSTLDESTDWYVGITTQQELEALAETIESEDPHAAAIVAKADISVPSLHRGIEYLRHALGFPMSRFVSLEQVN